MVPDGRTDGRNGRTDGRRQNYIPPTSSGDKKKHCQSWTPSDKNSGSTHDCKSINSNNRGPKLFDAYVLEL